MKKMLLFFSILIFVFYLIIIFLYNFTPLFNGLRDVEKVLSLSKPMFSGLCKITGGEYVDGFSCGIACTSYIYCGYLKASDGGLPCADSDSEPSMIRSVPALKCSDCLLGSYWVLAGGDFGPTLDYCVKYKKVLRLN